MSDQPEGPTDAWLREVSGECFRWHHRIYGQAYGPNGQTPSSQMKRASRKLGEAAERLQEVIHLLELQPRRHHGHWWAYDPVHDSDTGPYAMRREAQEWINDIQWAP